MITVCPLSRLAETIERTGARHVISLVNAGTPMAIPPSVPKDNHLFLPMNDIVDPVEGMTLPAADHVEAFLAYVQSWGRQGPLVIHCFAGISRSTAAAFIGACVLAPQRAETDIAIALRQASPSATPNRRLVMVADEILERKGRMVSAVDRIGRGENAFEGKPFTLDID